MPKGHSIIASNRAQLARRGTQPPIVNVYVRGVIVFKYGVVEPGGDYTTIREEIARLYNVLVQYVRIDVTSGSAIVDYSITSDPGESFPTTDVVASEVVEKIQATSDSGITFTDNNTFATYSATYSSAIASPPAAIGRSLVFQDIFYTNGRLKRYISTLYDGETLNLLGDIFIQSGETLTLMAGARIITGRYMIWNEGTINNGGTIDNNGPIFNKSLFNNNGIINSSNGLSNIGKFCNNQGATFNNRWQIINETLDGKGGIFINDGLINNDGSFALTISSIFFNNNTFKNVRDDSVVDSSGLIENRGTIDSSNGTINNGENIGAGVKGIIINTSLISVSNNKITNNGIIYNYGGSVTGLVGQSIGPNAPISNLIFSDVFDSDGLLKENYILPSEFGLTLTQSVVIEDKTFALLENSLLYNPEKVMIVNNGGTITNGGIIINHGSVRNGGILNNNKRIINDNAITLFGGTSNNLGTIGPNAITNGGCITYSQLLPLAVYDPRRPITTTIPSGCNMFLLGDLVVENRLIIDGGSRLYTNGFTIHIGDTGDLFIYGTLINNNNGRVTSSIPSYFRVIDTGKFINRQSASIIPTFVNTGQIINDGGTMTLSYTYPKDIYIIHNRGQIYNINDGIFTMEYGMVNSGTLINNPFGTGGATISGSISKFVNSGGKQYYPTFSDLFDSNGFFKQNYKLRNSSITLTQSVVIKVGQTLTLLDNSFINTNGFTLTNNGTISNVSGKIINDRGGKIINNALINNTGEFENNPDFKNAIIINNGTITGNPIISPCPEFSTFFDDQGKLKQKYTLPSGCVLTLTRPITIEGGPMLTLSPGSQLITNGNRIGFGFDGYNNLAIVSEGDATINLNGVHIIDPREKSEPKTKDGHGVLVRIGYRNTTATIRNGKIVQLKLDFYLDSSDLSILPSGHGTNSPVIQVFSGDADGVISLTLQEGTTGTKTIEMDANYFRIRVTGNASNTWGDQASAELIKDYQVNRYGIVFP